MSRPRSNNSLIEKIERMLIAQECFFDNVSDSYVRNTLARVRKKYPNRQYTHLLFYTHKGATYVSLRDFKPVHCIIRYA